MADSALPSVEGACDTTECYARWQQLNYERDMQLERAILAETAVERLRDVLARHESMMAAARKRSVGHYPCDLFPEYVIAEAPDGTVRRYFPSAKQSGESGPGKEE